MKARNLNEVAEIIFKTAREKERQLLSLREYAERRNMSTSNNTVYQFDKARLIGVLDIMDSLGLDRSEFNWIF